MTPLDLGYAAASKVGAVESRELTPPWRSVLTTSELESLVNNGGFTMFFDEDRSPELFEDTRADLDTISAEPFHELYLRAFEIFSNGSLSPDEKERQFDKLDGEFYRLMRVPGKSLPEYLGTFIKNNPTEFTKTYAQFLGELESNAKA